MILFTFYDFEMNKKKIEKFNEFPLLICEFPSTEKLLKETIKEIKVQSDYN